MLQSAPADPPVYLTWLIRPGPGGCTIRLQIDEIDTADSLQDAEDIWLPVLEALQQLVNPGRLPEGQVYCRPARRQRASVAVIAASHDVS